MHRELPAADDESFLFSRSILILEKQRGPRASGRAHRLITHSSPSELTSATALRVRHGAPTDRRRNRPDAAWCLPTKACGSDPERGRWSGRRRGGSVAGRRRSTRRRSNPCSGRKKHAGQARMSKTGPALESSGTRRLRGRRQTTSFARDSWLVLPRRVGRPDPSLDLTATTAVLVWAPITVCGVHPPGP